MKLKIDRCLARFLPPPHTPHLDRVSVILTLQPAARIYKRSEGAAGKSLQSTRVLSVSSVPNKAKAPKVSLNEWTRGASLAARF